MDAVIEWSKTGQWEFIDEFMANSIIQKTDFTTKLNIPSVTRALLNMNLNDLLKAASKHKIVNALLQSADFWANKLSDDIPEMQNKNVWDKLTRGIPMKEKYFTDSNPKARNVYMVFRELVYNAKKSFFNSKYDTTRKWQPKKDSYVEVNYEWQAGGVIKRSVLVLTVQSGKNYNISFHSWLYETHHQSEYDYLESYLEKHPEKLPYNLRYTKARSNPNWQNEYVAVIKNLREWDRLYYFLYFQYHLGPHFPCPISENEVSSLLTMFENGYVKKPEKRNAPVGTCMNCQDKPAEFVLACCQQVEYCSQECAQQHWDTTHKDECSF